jgi:hypothetical protein
VLLLECDGLDCCMFAEEGGSTAGAPLLQRRRRFVLDSCGGDRLQQYSRLYPPFIILLICVSTLHCDVYQYK